MLPHVQPEHFLKGLTRPLQLRMLRRRHTYQFASENSTEPAKRTIKVPKIIKETEIAGSGEDRVQFEVVRRPNANFTFWENVEMLRLDAKLLYWEIRHG